VWRGNGDRLWRRRRKKSTRGEGEVEVEGEDRCRNKARPLSKFGGRAHRHWTDTGSFGKGKPAHQVIFFPDQPRGWPGTYTLLAGFSVRGPLTAPFTCCACSVKKKHRPLDMYLRPRDRLLLIVASQHVPCAFKLWSYQVG
jgi:hypothetical protein